MDDWDRVDVMRAKALRSNETGQALHRALDGLLVSHGIGLFPTPIYAVDKIQTLRDNGMEPGPFLAILTLLTHGGNDA